MIFIDTSAFLAIEDRRDTHHKEAVAFRDACLKRGDLFITSDYILDESFTIIRRRAGHLPAVHFGEALWASRFVQIELITAEIFEAAWRIFKTRTSQEFSFTDCTSFALMEKMRIHTSFTFDSDFQKYGKFFMKPYNEDAI